MPCEWISLDAMDISGDMHLDVVRFACFVHAAVQVGFSGCEFEYGPAAQDHDVYKRRLDSSGKPIDEGQKHEVGPQNDPDLEAKSNGSYCGSCYGAGAEGDCCNSCEEVLCCCCG